MPSTLLLPIVVSMVTKGVSWWLAGLECLLSAGLEISPSLLIHLLHFTDKSEWKASKYSLTPVGFFWKLLSISKSFFNEPFRIGVWSCFLPS